MFCKNCGTQIPDEAVFCSVCGANQMADTTVNNSTVNANAAYVQPQNLEYNNIAYQNYPVNTKPDKSNVGLNILSWFIPIFGIIYYFIKKSEKPIEAKGTLKTALISIGVNILVSIIAVVLVFVGVFSASNNEEYDDSVVDGYEEIYNATDDNAEESDDENTTDDVKSNVNISTKWTDYTVSVEGVEITLPISYKDFAEKTGCTFSDLQDAETTLKSNYYTWVDIKGSNGSKFTINLLNKSENVKTLGECMVTSISQYNNYSDENVDIVFPGNIRIGNEITETELKELFGEPDDTYKSDDDTYFVYTYYENYDSYYSKRSFEITVSNGVIIDVSLDKTAY